MPAAADRELPGDGYGSATASSPLGERSDTPVGLCGTEEVDNEEEEEKEGALVVFLSLDERFSPLDLPLAAPFRRPSTPSSLGEASVDKAGFRLGEDNDNPPTPANGGTSGGELG